MALIIFDFDGTIADSFDYVVSFLEKHVRHGETVSELERQSLRGMTMPQMAQKLGSPRWKLPWLFIIGRRAMGRAIYNVPMFEGMGHVLDQLQSQGHELAIVSSNNGRNIRKFLKQHHLYKFFADIYGGAGFFGKRRAIRSVLWRNRIKPHDAWYIGDEVRDIDGAKAAAVRVISVTWGFDNKPDLQSHKPTATADVPQDIIRILEEQ